VDNLQQQIVALQEKVDAVFKLLAELNEQITNALATEHRTDENGLNEAFLNHLSKSQHSRSRVNSYMIHKDVLIESDPLGDDDQTGERAFTPEIQIQRLTAQLTAAYNRIAALEEQLLAKRVQ
jgi:hypothetical protein